MYCPKCGTQLPEDAKFCPNCGTPVQGQQGNAGTAEDAIDQAIDHVASGVEDAASDMKEDFQNAGASFKEGGKKVSDAAENVRNNWRDYLTPENIEAFVAASTMFGLADMAVCGSMFLFMSIDWPFSRLIGVVRVIVGLIFLVAAALGIVGVLYLMQDKKEKQSLWGYVTLGAVALSFLACLGMLAKWGVIAFLFSLVAALYGIDLLARVLILHEGIEGTPQLQRDLSSYKQFYEQYKAAHPSEEDPQVQMAMGRAPSYFDGRGLTLFGYQILEWLLAMITCNIATPWMQCKILRWRKSHTVINGKRLAFTGTGGSLLGHWILWSLLTLITCGIYGFFAYVAYRRWELKHTFYADGTMLEEGQITSNFDGNSFQYFGYGLLATLVGILTLGIALPWMLNLIYKWEAKHSIVCGDRMQYTGSALGLFFRYIGVFLLTVITLGIYSPWATVVINKYMYSHYRVQNSAPVNEPPRIESAQ